MHKTEDLFHFRPQSMNQVKVRGEALDFVLWQGKQWAVTEYGLECRDGRYHIDAKSLMTAHGRVNSKDQSFTHWFQHISGKNWVDADDLDAALQAAMLLFEMNGARSKAPAPLLLENEAEIEEYATMCANKAYEEARAKAMRGLVFNEELKGA